MNNTEDSGQSRENYECYATGVAAVAVTLVLVSLAAAAFELHNIPGMSGAGFIILSKK